MPNISAAILIFHFLPAFFSLSVIILILCKQNKTFERDEFTKKGIKVTFHFSFIYIKISKYAI